MKAINKILEDALFYKRDTYRLFARLLFLPIGLYYYIVHDIWLILFAVLIQLGIILRKKLDNTPY